MSVMKLIFRLTRFVSRIAWRFKRTSAVLIVLIVFLFETVSPAYFLAEAMYFESRDEGVLGQLAVVNVILNRRADRRFPKTIRRVVHAGVSRGRSCDFSYYCDHKSDNPWLHRRSKWPKWVKVRVLSWFCLVIHPDITGGATYYKRHDVRSPWFNKKIKAGRMCKTKRIGAHVFYKYK